MTDRATDDDDGEYVCHVCGETFDSAATLHRHVREQGLVD
jgi:hypothetical protein